MPEDSGLRTICGLHGFVVDFLASPPAPGLEDLPGVPDAAWETVHLDNTFAWGLNRRATDDKGALAAAFEVASESGTAARAVFGAFDGFTADLNDETVAAPRADPAPNAADNAFTVRLRPGANRFLVRVDTSEAGAFFGLRLTAPDGGPLAGVRVTRPRPPQTPPGQVVTTFERFNGLLAEEPSLVFRGEGRGEWKRWRQAFRTKLLELMGPFPDRPEPDARVVERVELPGYVREKVLVKSEQGVWVPAWILIPHKPNGRTAVCLHGHGDGTGKVVGVNASDPEAAASIARHNYDYGRQFAERGYVVMNPVFRCFGERRGPDHLAPAKDYCDATFIKAFFLGFNLLTLDIHDAQCCLDYLCTRPEVDASRLACLGLSYGGRTTMYLAAVDERIRAAVISGALNTFRERIVHGTSCGSQFVRGLLRYGDTPEVMGSIVPRPLLIELGKGDGCCPEIVATDAYATIQRTYAAADAADRLAIDIFDRGHRFSGRVAFDWLERWV